MGERFIRAADVRDLLRLVEECRELVADGHSASSHLRRGLARITDAHSERESELYALLRAALPWLSIHDDAASPSSARLSPRERDTLRLLLTGAPEKDVAERLGVSPHTAHHYVKAVYKKLGVTRRAELMARAARRA
jgi:DNA-binding CsgD family transcriptional regulator